MARQEPRDPAEVVLRVHGPIQQAHAIPAEVLVRAIAGMQQTVLLLAAVEDKQVVRERFRPSEKLRRRATLLCDIPTAGSYALPLRLANDPVLLDFGGRKFSALDAAYELISAIGEGTEAKLIELLPDSAIRSRVMREVHRFAPRPGEPWAIGLSAYGKPEAILDERVTTRIDEWIAQSDAAENVMTVIGELTRIHFDEHKISIRYAPTNKTINCSLREEVVDELLEDRTSRLRAQRNFSIQVTGKFELDAHGHPKKLTDVYRVVPVDTSPMVFKQIRHSNRMFEFRDTLCLDVAMDEESGQLYVAEAPELGISAYAHTREELVEEIAEQIAFNWREYAECEPNLLAKGAQRLRDALLAHISAAKEDTNA